MTPRCAPLLLVLCAPVPAVGQTPAVAFETSPRLPAEDTPFIDAATAAFKAQCGPLMRYWPDVQTAHAEVTAAGITQETERGWTRRVVLRIDIREAPQLIPASWEAAGQTCYFDLGGGDRPGLDVGMPLCRSLCAVPAPGFVPLPALKGMN